MKINLQRCVATCGVSELVNNSVLGQSQLYNAFTRLANGDYGTLCDADKKANEYSVKRGEGMVMGIYDIDGTTFWIISYLGKGGYTTALLPEEY